MSKYSYADLEMLLIRLLNVKRQGKKIAVLFGSGLTTPNLKNAELGVSSVTEIISDIKDYFLKINSLKIFERNVKAELSEQERYQAAMQTLLSVAGQDELNNVIIRSVLNSMISKPVINITMPDIDPEALEKEYQNWYLRKGADSLGELYVDFNEVFACPLLTSNFDPLMEISIRKHEGNPQSVFLAGDGKFLNLKSDKTHSVVHFHGFWHGSDTLHTIDQLKRVRPQLKGDLKKMLGNSVLLVIGYGGWNDIFTNTLLELIKEGNNNFDVLWCFHEEKVEELEKKYFRPLDQMSTSIGQRVVLYKNIDCHSLFPQLLTNFNSTENTLQHSPLGVQDTNSNGLNSNVTITIDGFDCDTPPNNLFWVGREDELNILSKFDYKACFITGFGGQGKSGLASHFVRNVAQKIKKIEFWDWRDCKEEDNKFQTVIISQIERLSKGSYRASKIANENIEDLISLFFELLAKREIIFVYDNVDKYIDLVDLKPIGGLGKLFDKANKRDHNASFIFTCRPHVISSLPSFLELNLKELSLSDTIQLFTKYEPPFSKTDIEIIANQSHSLTNGHVLWLTLIAAQCKRGLPIVNSFLEDYSKNKVDQKDNPSYSLAQNTLDVLWKSLNQKQQTLLRGMAEMVTSFDKDELDTIFKSVLSSNQFNKAFKFLNSLNLLVVKSQEGKKDLFELHPLVKEYILNKYRRNERSKFIMLIVNFYNQIIVWIKPKLDADSPLSYFEKYTQKAELQINNSDFKGALSSLQEISDVIRSAGYSEEYIRVATFLFKNIDWLRATTEEYQYFHDQVYDFIYSIIEKGKFPEVDGYLEKYINIIQGKSINYLNYCSLNSYYNWFKNDFKAAIEWAEKGIEIQEKAGVGSEIDLSQKHALALRDTRDPENIDKALNLFLKGEKLENVLKETFSSENFSSEFFGNIGRCLWFKDQVKYAAICYYKSFNILISQRQGNTVLNMGFACLWLSEYAIKNGDEMSALHFIEYCLICWEKAAPIKAVKVRNEFADIINNRENSLFFTTLSNWDTEKYCKEFVDKDLKQIYSMA